MTSAELVEMMFSLASRVGAGERGPGWEREMCNDCDDEFGDEPDDYYGPEEPTNPGLEMEEGPLVPAKEESKVEAPFPRLVVVDVSVSKPLCYLCGAARTNVRYERSPSDGFPCCPTCLMGMELDERLKDKLDGLRRGVLSRGG